MTTGTPEVTNAIMAIAETNKGTITPEQVVEAARDPRSALHHHFTWDNDAAAHAHRLNEARALIRTVKIDVTVTNFATAKAPQFVRTPDLRQQPGYISVGILRDDPDQSLEVLMAEFQRAAMALRRAQAVAVVLGLRENVVGLQRQVELLLQQAEDMRTEPRRPRGRPRKTQAKAPTRIPRRKQRRQQ
jgi:hypothetical protein